MLKKKKRVPLIPGTPAARRRKRPMVVVHLLSGAERLTPRIVELARALDWQVLDLHFYMGLLPLGLQPQGAFVDCLPTDPLVRHLQRVGCRVVRLGGQPHPLGRSVPDVSEDLTAAGRLAAEHFAERKFRHVGFVGFKPLSNFKRLYEGLRDRAVELGGACHLLEFSRLTEAEKPQTWAEAIHLRNREFADWIARVPKPIGVLAFSDGMAGRLCGVAQQAGLAVPMEVAFLGHGNNVTVCESAPVALSSIQCVAGQAEMAVRVMQDLLAGKRGPAAPVLVAPSGIARRASTDVLATADPGVAAALRYIWEHLEQNLSVADVAQAVGVSNRHLLRRFQAQLGHGINAELRRKRLEMFRELLITTGQPIGTLAPAAGFPTLGHLYRLFQRTYGMAPQEYRAQFRGTQPGAEKAPPRREFPPVADLAHGGFGEV